MENDHDDTLTLMGKVTINQEFDSIDDREELRNFFKSSEYYSVLLEIDQDLRTKLKYGEDDWLENDVCDYLNSLRQIIWDSGAFADE